MSASRVLRSSLASPPELDGPITSYLDSLFADPDPSDLPIDNFILPLLQSMGITSPEEQDAVCEALRKLWEQGLPEGSADGAAGVKRLETALDMRRTEHLSKRNKGLVAATVGANVDISSTVKGRATQVDIKKLEKAEAKIKAKMEKRDRRNAYEASKLVDAAANQESFEELFMQINPLPQAGASEGKSKDIHLDAIDVTFGSHRILSGAELTLAQGRRYGLIGRNGIGKSTLLRTLALREVAIPTHISILYVEQEVRGDDTTAIDSVLSADVHRTRLLREEKELNALLKSLELPPDESTEDGGFRVSSKAEEEAQVRLGEVQKLLVEMDADSGPSRAAELLAGLGFEQEDQQKPTRSFSGGWRMRLSLARALFCAPDLLLLDEPSNNLDINSLAWLENHLQTWPHTVLVVSHDRSFLDAVATDIIHQHSERLEYYKGNFAQFYATREERRKNQQREYDSQLQYRQHLQAFIDRWRYNANRAPAAQQRIKVLEKLPDLQPPEADDVVTFKFAETDKISPPLLQLADVNFTYPGSTVVNLAGVSIDVGLESRIGIIGPNGAGKSTLMKLLIGELQPTTGQHTRNGRLRIAYFAQHHIDSLDLSLTAVGWLARNFPGKTETEYRSHLGAFGITGLTGVQVMRTLSGGQKSRVSFATLSMQRPHVLLLDEPTNHLDIEGLDALMIALNQWNGGVIVISHDSTFINTVCKQLWVVADHKAEQYYGDVSAYKKLIVANAKSKPM